MILKKIELKNYRIHQNTEIKFSENKNYIIGGNGQGKTSVLEAIYYLCTSKNFTSCSDSEVISFNEKYFEVTGSFKDLTENNVRIFYTLEDNKKNIFIDGKQIFKASEIIGRYPVVILTPEDHKITQGAPGDRRKFIDSVISQASDTYLKILLDYNKTLRQRSSLLSQIKESGKVSLIEQLDAWNIQLVQTGTELIKRRIKFIEQFVVYLKESYMWIMNKKEEPEVKYEFINGCSLGENIEGNFFSLLKKKQDEELRRGMNLVGPHRDEYIFLINDIDLRKFGSQGQHKTFQVALRFAQFFYLKEKLAKTPVFLMDDVFGELDAYRASKISEHLKDIGQAFITLTDLSNFSHLTRNEQDFLIQVTNGKAEYV